MSEITRSRTIGAPRDLVWSTLADFGAISRWADAVDHSCLLRGEEVTVGTARRVQVGRLALIERIVELEPPGVLAYTIDGVPGPARTVQNRWTLVPAGDGAATVALTSAVEIGHRPPQRVAERVACRILAAQSDRMLADLAAHLEASRV